MAKRLHSLRPIRRTREVIAGNVRLVEHYPTPMRIGIVADTHCDGDALSPALLRVLDGCDLILHAGDIGAVNVLDTLGDIAPVLAVRGNHDTGPAFAALPAERFIRVGSHLLGVIHGRDGLPSRRDKRMTAAAYVQLARAVAAERFAGEVDVLVMGHTHADGAFRHVSGMILVNAGSTTQPRMGTPASIVRLEIAATIDVDFPPLQ